MSAGQRQLLALLGMLWLPFRIFAADSPTPPPLVALGGSTFQMGEVVLDKSAKIVRFPARMNLDSGLIEYLIVTANGKAYESLLSTTAQPYHIHLAMLLIGAKGSADTAALREAPSEPFVNRPPGAAPLPPPLGDPIWIGLAWTNHGRTNLMAAENGLRNLRTGSNAAPGIWIYNGSRVLKGQFVAQREGSVVAVIDDIDALVNNPRPGRDNDKIWEINTNALPPLGTTVEVTFKLQENK